MENVYIIGEIGQNHNGSVDIAKLLIDVVSRPVVDELFDNNLKGMNAVKMTKRDLDHELSVTQMSKLYDNKHSFGKTYGEHRRFLELSDEEHFECYNYAKNNGLDFVETLCAIGCLSILKLFTPDRLKVASRDVTNLPLLEALAETKIPIIISTGMAGKRELDDAIEVVTKYHNNLSILHCVSEYPTKYSNVNLKTIDFLKRNYKEFAIGYSDHTIGIATPIAAVAKGAKLIEKHITLDRQMKGTDQAGSLAVDGINRMVRDIRNLEMSIGVEDIIVPDSVNSAKKKLERSLATIRDMNEGDIIKEEDLHLLSPGDGIKWVDRSLLIGKRLKKGIRKDEIIYLSNLK
ncbi:N-acetylneuraminate synthase family protein [Carboxylicivirga linearis]|uniref:N-acetylneuraminate synthase family protein n=1 Tax=Carboxylicivirga linearis TaxID=1628157 RepID=A0ABS5K146_9BACT|nr:N-acetylneuraminate synthase family protein [Carboxylicivirga linearis]MBS2100775.1 N-acetylneuraminate synthase family protein [Carboxylicivirga linearis]